MIGFLDSGFGGLTVMKEYLKQYPDFDYLYLGDQGNSPYGSHSKERITEVVEKNVKYLIDQGCRMIIIACNTASADALRAVQLKYKGNPVILGVLVPAVEEALQKTRFGRLGVIGTRGTIKSEAYMRELDKYKALYQPEDKKAQEQPTLVQQAAPLLVPLVEEGYVNTKEVRSILKKYLRPLKSANVDTLILGCTHYAHLEQDIQRIMGKNCQLICSGTAGAKAINEYFKKHPEMLKSISTGKTRTYITTDCPEHFAKVGSQFLGGKITAKRVDIN